MKFNWILFGIALLCGLFWVAIFAMLSIQFAAEVGMVALIVAIMLGGLYPIGPYNLR